MRFRIKRRRHRKFKNRGKGIPYIYNNKIYIGKKQRGGGVVSKTLARILQGVGDVTGL